MTYSTALILMNIWAGLFLLRTGTSPVFFIAIAVMWGIVGVFGT